MSVLGDWALSYAASGWRVAPLWALREDGSCECRDGGPGGTCTAAGKHPRIRDWVNVATTDAASITDWWTQWPHANVCVVTGSGSGVFVVDVDPRHGGDASIEQYEQGSVMGLPLTMTAMTGGGGRHLFYRYPEGLAEQGLKLGNLVDWLPGVDVRGEGGQVVLPYSPHSSGRIYMWSDGWQQGPADAPEELVTLILRSQANGGAGGGMGSGGDLPGADEILAGVEEGQRNDTLFRWGCQLRRRLQDERGAVDLLLRRAGEVAGLPASEIDLIIGSVWRQDHSLGADAWMAGVGSAWSQAAAGSSEENVNAGEIPVEGVGWNPGEPLPLTDLGNAMRLEQRYRDALRYSAGGGWWSWSGGKWERDELRAELLAQSLSGLLLLEAEGDDDRADELRRFARSSESGARISTALKLARSRPGIAVRDEIWDSDPWLLNMKNGVLDLRSLRVRPHDRADLCTKVAATSWDGSAGLSAAAWEKFLVLVLPDPDVRWFVQKAVGYSLTGVVDAKCLFILHGGGNNGKSVFLETLRDCVFGDYASVCTKSAVISTRNEEHLTAVASLVGARFITLSEEIGQGDKLNMDRLKSMTGGDLMAARFMRQDEFKFKPQMKLWIGTNHKPGLTSFEAAVRARVRLVPFEHQFGPDDARPATEVKREFQAEAQGILGWAIEGLRGYLLEGLEPPSVVLQEVDEWMDEDDAIGTFIRECCEVVEDDKSRWMSFVEAHQAYTSWATSTGSPMIGARRFRSDLANRPGLAKSRPVKGSMRRYGIALHQIDQWGNPIVPRDVE